MAGLSVHYRTDAGTPQLLLSKGTFLICTGTLISLPPEGAR